MSTMPSASSIAPSIDGPTGTGDAAIRPRIYRCGSLTYTPRHLAVLFFWLLWGDFCYVLMESVTAPIMQLKFKALGASNTEMGLLLATIPATMGAFLNPVISFRSDRFRSRWGRRIPFLLATLPFLAVCLVLLGLGDRIGLWIHGLIGGESSLARVTIWTFAVLLMLFTFFNTFVNSVFWYLFNDVVPEVLLARFMSWFRVFGMASGALYSVFIFPHSGSHVTEIMCGAAVLYAVGFTLMCLNVKEGDYPPPPLNDGGGSGAVAGARTYIRECHSLPHYWYLWAATCINSIGAGIGMYSLFMNQKLGLSLEQIGEIGGAMGLVGAVSILASGWLADRYHPLRVVLAGAILSLAILLPANLLWLFWVPSSNQTVFWLSILMAVGLSAPISALSGVMDPPLLMRLFPRSRYGQFCSANNLWRTLGAVIGVPLAGLFIDLMIRLVGEAQAYFWLPVWQMCFAIPSLGFLLLLYRSWKRYGGDQGYQAPVAAAAGPT